MRLWDLTAADPNAAVRTLAGHLKAVTNVAFAPDGKTLASVSNDKTVRLWDATAADPNAAVRTLAGHLKADSRVSLLPGGNSQPWTSGDSTVRLWTAGLDKLLDQAHRRAYRNLTPEEWDRFFPGERYAPTFPDLPVPSEAAPSERPSSAPTAGTKDRTTPAQEPSHGIAAVSHPHYSLPLSVAPLNASKE